MEEFLFELSLLKYWIIKTNFFKWLELVHWNPLLEDILQTLCVINNGVIKKCMHSHIIYIYEYRTRAVKDKYTYHRRIKRIFEATDRYPPVPFQFQTCTIPENWGEIKTQRFGTYWFNQQDENVKRSFSRWNSRRSILNIHLCFYQTIPRPKNIHVSYARLRIQDIQIYRFKWFALCFIPFSLLFCFSSLRIFLSFLSFLRSNFLPSTPFFINSDLRSELSLSLSLVAYDCFTIE